MCYWTSSFDVCFNQHDSTTSLQCQRQNGSKPTSPSHYCHAWPKNGLRRPSIRRHQKRSRSLTRGVCNAEIRPSCTAKKGTSLQVKDPHQTGYEHANCFSAPAASGHLLPRSHLQKQINPLISRLKIQFPQYVS